MLTVNERKDVFIPARQKETKTNANIALFVDFKRVFENID